MQMLRAAVLFAAAATVAGAQENDASARSQGGQLDSYHLLVSHNPWESDEYSPKVLLHFDNPFDGNSSAGLGFSIEWTANGVAQNPNLNSPRGRCIFGTYEIWCTVLRDWLGDKPAFFANRTPVAPREFPQGFNVVNLEYDTRYCFRLRATAFKYVAGQDVTAPWSGWSCARTRVAPPPIPLPTAPLQPHVTILPATDGIGVPGGPLPVRALIEWEVPGEKPAENIDTYLVEKAWLESGNYTLRWDGVESIKATDKRAETTLTFPAGEEPTDARRYQIRVCSVNATGRRCSPGRATTPFTPGPLAQKSSRREYPSNADVSVTDGSAPESTDRAAKLEPPTKLNLPKAVKPVGKVKLPAGTPTNPPKPICDLANQARARNSPAAPGLERQCVDDLANRGGAIAEVDSAVAATRRAESDPSYRLGFDIATGIFGDPELGALGNTATGPFSLRIRAGLNVAGRRGFDSAVKFHDSRR